MTSASIPIDAYREVAPPGVVDFLLRLAERVRGRRFVHVNSTRVGGGVAEILNRLVPMLTELGVDTTWEVIEGDADFFTVTKAFHNALQGAEVPLADAQLEHYLHISRKNAVRLALAGDLVLIHDPQPAALVEARPREGRWVWRCHIDLSTPHRRVWAFLRRFISWYDAAVFSLPAFAHPLSIPQFLVYPSIDPLSDKNRPLEAREVETILATLAVPADKPMLLQVSRFDRFKDPVGVINAYRMVKRYYDVRLVLAGGGAADDPEGALVLAEVRAAASGDPDIHVLDLPADAHLQINALQRAATIVLQKSTREGFGLTVAEAMWKGKPVIGGATGGIMVQVQPGVTGYTVRSVEGAAFRLRQLLGDPGLMRAMGEAGREHVRQNFLITRHLRDYLSLLVHLTQ
ncbi:MAG: glycosyl transferase family 1 [Candidatus Rokubacteria bacterium GWC2_70_16]|nr:MAG: glycosyl transferase family 1 [Candidatus Rokubacteria bacterium GWC2_70_16]